MGMAQRDYLEYQEIYRRKRNISLTEVKPFNIPKKNVKKANRTLRMIFYSLIAITTVLFVVINLRYGQIAKLNVQITDLDAKIEKLETDRDNYKLELEPYKTPQRIQTVAREELKMRYPTSEETSYLQSKGKEVQNENKEMLENSKANEPERLGIIKMITVYFLGIR